MNDAPATNAYQKVIAVFLDVLGTKSRKTFDEKLEVHRIFHGEVRRNAERQANIPHVIYDRKIWNFSDCAYFLFFYKPHIDDSRKDDSKLLFTSLNNVSLSILKLFNSGYFVRGGAAIGDGYFDDSGFFGPVIEEAYRFESKEALYPRIVVTKEIGEMLIQNESSIERPEIFNDIFKTRPQLIYQAGNQYCLNPFYQLQTSSELNLDGTAITLEGIKQTMLESARQQLAIHNTDEKIVEKMEWILKEIPAI